MEKRVRVWMLSHFSHVQLFATPWTVARQAPQSMGILQTRILEWVAMPSSRGSSGLRNQTCISLCLLNWQVGSLPLVPPGKSYNWGNDLLGKTLILGKIEGRGEKGATEDEMVGWHYWLNGYQFEQTLGDSEGQRRLACCSPWGHKELDTTERRQWHPTPGLLPGKSHGRRSLVGCSPWGCWESTTTERLHFPFSLSCIGEGNGNPLQCSCLENPRDGGAWWAVIYGVAQSQIRLKQRSSSRETEQQMSKIVASFSHGHFSSLFPTLYQYPLTSLTCHSGYFQLLSPSYCAWAIKTI